MADSIRQQEVRKVTSRNSSDHIYTPLKRLIPVIAVILVVGYIFVSILVSQVQAANNPTVNISNFKYSPSTVTIAQGDKVTWVNKDGIPHTVTANDKKWDSGDMNHNATFSHTFDKPGTYKYHCEKHPYMQGMVIVK